MSADVIDVYVEVIQGIKVDSAGVMNIDDVWSFVNKTQSSGCFDPWLVL